MIVISKKQISMIAGDKSFDKRIAELKGNTAKSMMPNDRGCMMVLLPVD